MNSHRSKEKNNFTHLRKLTGRLSRWGLRIVLSVLFLVVVLAGIGVLVLQTAFVQNRLRNYLAETASRKLNASVAIGELEGNLLSDLTLKKIRLESPDSIRVLSIDSLTVRYLLPKLFFNIIQVEDLSVKGVRLELVKSSDGEWNLPFLQEGANPGNEESAHPFPVRVNVESFDLSDAQITVRPGAGATSLKISRLSFGFGYDTEILLSNLESFLAFGPPNDLPLGLSGDLAFDPAMSKLTISHLFLESENSRVMLDGNFSFSENNPWFSFSLTASPVILAKLSESFSLPELPDVEVSGTLHVSGTPSEFRHNISLELDGAALNADGSGGFDTNRGLWSELSASFHGLELSKGWIPDKGMLTGTVSGDILLKASGLQSAESVDAHASLELREVVASGIPLDNVHLSATWSHDCLSVEQLAASSGQNHLNISGSFIPRNRAGKIDLFVDLDRADALLDLLKKHYPDFFSDVSILGNVNAAIFLEGSLEHPSARFSIASSQVSFLSAQAAHMDLKGLWQELPGPGSLLEDIDLNLQGFSSDPFRADSLSLRGNWRGWLQQPDADFSISALNVSRDRLQSHALHLSGSLHGLPSDENASADFVLSSSAVRFDDVDIQDFNLSANWDGPFSGPSGHGAMSAGNASIFGERFARLSSSCDFSPESAIFNLSVNHENGSIADIKGIVSPWNTDRKVVSIDKLFVSTASPWPESTLSNTAPIRLTLQESVLTFDDCRLAVNDATLSLAGGLSAIEANGLIIQADRLEIGSIPGDWNDHAEISGLVSANVALNGPWSRPLISSDIRVSHLTGYGISQSSDLSATVMYTDSSASVHASLTRQETPLLTADSHIPIAISLWPVSIKTGTKDMKASISTRDLKFSELPIPKIDGIEWDAVSDMNLTLSGSLQAPDVHGDIRVRDGHLTLTRNKLTYETIEGSIQLSGNRINIDNLLIEGDREGRLMVSGAFFIREGYDFDSDLTLSGDKFYIPFQKSISARISPDLHLTGGLKTPHLRGEVTIDESRVNLDQLSRQRYSEIQVVESSTADSGEPVLVASQSEGSGFLSPLTADILVRAPKNAWLKGQDLNAEISGEISVSKKPGEPFVLTGPLNTLRGHYYFMGKTFQLTKGNVEFTGLSEINPNLDIEAQTRINSATIIVRLHGTAQEITVDLNSNPPMDESDIISYLVFGHSTDNLGGDQAFSVEKAAMNYVGGLLAVEFRDLLGDVEYIDTFSIDPSSDEDGIGSVTLGKYVTPELFISHSQSLSENEASYQEISYELTPSIKLETQIGKDFNSSVDLTWEFDF